MSVKELCQMYRGLREADLWAQTPEKSCVVCGCIECYSHNRSGKGCNKHKKVEESEWIVFYDFIKSAPV